VVVVVDAAVLADDEAAGRAHLEGGAALSPAQARRLACDAAVTAIVTDGGQVLAEGRARRYATRAQRRALLVRDGGCARPGCEETRIERLHAHHLRHWLFGGRTDLANLVLLCDTDHGLVHEHDLVMSRTGGRLVVLDGDGRHVWGTADAAFPGGLTGLDAERTADGDPFVGVSPIDTVVGRRPAVPVSSTPAARVAGTGRILHRRPTPARRPDPRRDRTRRTAPAGPTVLAGRPPSRRPGRRTAFDRPPEATAERQAARVSRILYPAGEPALADSLQERYDRMDLRYALGVLMDNRDLARRLAAEGRTPYGA
jgi:hypothetical protein